MVRTLVRELGHHYRTINSDLPGNPDLANRSAGWAIFVHGCFWHGHAGCARAKLPATNRKLWAQKIRTNIRRDRVTTRELQARGYRTIIVWQCQLSLPRRVLRRIDDNLHARRRRPRRIERSSVSGLYTAKAKA
jgi:DNA mismatch endonuclease Vsr